MLKLIALFVGLAFFGAAGGYLVVKYQQGYLNIFESFSTTNPTIKSEVVNNSGLIKESEHQKTIREQVKAEVLAELENQRVAIANQQEAQRQVILQQQNEIYLKQQAELENQRVAIANQQEAQRQVILQQQNEAYLKQQAEQSRITDLQNKCREKKRKYTEKANKIREALIGGGDNMFTQFGDSQVQLTEELGNIEYEKCLQNIK